jgi:hypothetical protein
MSTSTTQVTVKKAGKGIEITDEAVLSGHGDVVGEGRKQLKMSVANKIDNDFFADLGNATLTASGAMGYATIFAGRAKFKEAVNQPVVLIVSPNNYVKIASEMVSLESNDQALISGVVGKYAGAQVVVSGKVNDATAYLVAPGALGLLLKRNVQVETDRDIIAKLTVITADEHYATYLKDESKAVKLTISA